MCNSIKIIKHTLATRLLPISGSIAVASTTATGNQQVKTLPALQSLALLI